jgi:hypothetical protein
MPSLNVMTATVDEIRAQAEDFRTFNRSSTYDGDAVFAIVRALLDAAGPRWRGHISWTVQDSTQLDIQLAEEFVLSATVTRSASISTLHFEEPRVDGRYCGRVLSTNRHKIYGWDGETVPAQRDWLDYAVGWIRRTNEAVEDVAVLRKRLKRVSRRYVETMERINDLDRQMTEAHAAESAALAEMTEINRQLAALGANES